MPLLLLRFRRACWLLVTLLLGAGQVSAQSPAPTWLSAATLGQRDVTTNTITSNTRVVLATVPDGQGNLYVAGYFVGAVTFGTTTLTSTPISTNPAYYSSDIFVAKWSVSGNRYLWAASAGGPGSESASQLVVSGNNLYLAGTTLSQNRQPGSVTFGATTLATGISYSIFVAKLTDTGTSGAWKWGKTGNNEYLADVDGLAVSGSAVYLAGNLSGTMTFDNKTVKSNQTLAYNAGDILLAKFTDNGPSATVNWVQLAGSATYEYTDAFAVSGTSLYVAGSYFNTSTIGTTTMPNTGKGLSTDAFVTKFTDTGATATPVWTQHLGGTGSERVASLVASGSNVYLAGHFSSPSLDLGTPVTHTLPNQEPTVADAYDLLLAKLVDAGASGSFAWARPAGGAGSEFASRLLRTGSTLFVAGTFQGPTATFGSTVLTNTTAAGGQQDVYVARFDETATGGGATLGWAQQAGSSSYDYVYSLNLLGSRLYVQGYANEAATFGQLALPKNSSYLASLAAAAPLAAAASAAPQQGLALSPNPVSQATTLTGADPATAVQVVDALGRTVLATVTSAAGTAQLVLPASLAPGVYLVRTGAQSARLLRQ